MLGMVALFTFDFPMCDVNMRKAKVKLLSLTNYNAMIDAALATNYIQESDVETLRQWREDPESWSTSRHMKDF